MSNTTSDESQVVIFDYHVHTQKKRCIYYAHGPYRRGGIAFVFPIPMEIVCSENASLLSCILGIKFSRSKLEKLDFSSDVVQQIRAGIIKKNIILKHEPIERKCKNPPKILGWYNTPDPNRIIFIRPGISIPKSIRPTVLFRDDERIADEEATNNLINLLAGDVSEIPTNDISESEVE